MTRITVSTGSTFEEEVGYSRVVVVGDDVFVSGTTGYDYKTMHIDTDVVAQAEQCMRNIDDALRQVGSSMDDVVRVRYLFVERDDFALCCPVFKRWFDRARPSATMMIVGLFDSKMRLEVEVTARRVNPDDAH